MCRRLGKVSGAVLLSALLVGGCMSGGSNCPLTPQGTCQSAKVTYNETVYGTPIKPGTPKLGDKKSVPSKEGKEELPPGGGLANSAPIKPIKEPAHDIRLWINNYRVENTVVSEHYIIWEAERGKFTLGRKVPAAEDKR